jgi:hypothetical protein
MILMLALSGLLRLRDAEYEEVLRRPTFRFAENAIAGMMDAIRTKGIRVKPAQAVTACDRLLDKGFENVHG